MLDKIKNKISSIWDSNKFGKSKRENSFTKIYAKNLWGKHSDGRKFYSGPGTVNENTKLYIETLSNFIQKNKIKTVFEVGCGDFSIMKQLLPTLDVHYLGADIVKDLINFNARNFGTNKIDFIHVDAVVESELPQADLCIIRQVLQHLSNKDILAILKKLKHYKFIIITEHIPIHPVVKNSDKSSGTRIRLDKRKPSGVFFDAPPFKLEHEILLKYREDHANTPALMQTILLKNKI